MGLDVHLTHGCSIRFQVNAQDADGNTPLHVSLDRSMPHALMLLQHNANIDILNAAGESPYTRVHHMIAFEV